VKTAALSLFGELHAQLGPILKAMVLSKIKDDSLKQQIEKKFASCPYDPSASASIRSRKCLVLDEEDDDDAGGGGASSLGMNIPKTDLLSELPSDILDRMVRSSFFHIIYIC